MKVGTWLKGRMPENLVIYLVSAESSFGIRFLESQGNPSQVQPGMNSSSKILVVENQSQAQPGMNRASTILVAEEPQRGVSSGRPTSVSQAGYTVVKETPTNRLLQGVSEGVQRRLSVGRSTSGSTHGQPVAKEPQEHQQNVFTGRSTSGFTGEHNSLEGFGSGEMESSCQKKKQQVVRTYKIDSHNKDLLHLMLELEVELEDGSSKFLQALVDTGAQRNLLKTGLVPNRCTRKSKDPLELIAANGETIRGGDRETTLRLRFEMVTHDGKVERQKPLKANFHLADIGVDVILAYPWLMATKVGIFPHLKSLAIPHAEQKLLRPTQGKEVSQSVLQEMDEDPDEVEVAVVSKKSTHKKRSDYWDTERYQVLPEMVEKILTQLEVTPTLDAFADPETHILPRWWGEGGECLDAFQTSWLPEVVGCLWANPPFSVLKNVVQKIVQDGAQMVLICPDWRYLKWWKQVQGLVVKEFFIPKGTKVFRSPDKENLRSTRWGVWAYLVDGSLVTNFVARIVEGDKRQEAIASGNFHVFGPFNVGGTRGRAARDNSKKTHGGLFRNGFDVHNSQRPPQKRSSWRGKDSFARRGNSCASKAFHVAR